MIADVQEILELEFVSIPQFFCLLFLSGEKDCPLWLIMAFYHLGQAITTARRVVLEISLSISAIAIFRP
jgi:hypothetical protein